MTIQQQVDDATFLAQNQRYVGALSLLLSAVATSSRKAFPGRGTGNQAAFKLFLGARLKNLLFGSNIRENVGLEEVGLPVLCQDRVLDIVQVLAEVYRAQHGYESELPPNVEFATSSSDSQAGIRVSCSSKGLALSVAVLDVLRRVVVEADCNARDFT